MSEQDEDLDSAAAETQREYRLAQSAHDAASRPAYPRDGLVPRFWKGYDSPDKYTCDAIYVDRTTGNIVMRYDAADPANTNPYYGATTDADCMAKKGLDIKELINPDQVKITDDQLQAMCAVYYDEDFGDYD